ncbi:MAG: DUF4252 domain-containing protein [Flavobacteriales bacterium]|nr:MAG: DUF4252 domain-containing protein [Flavobacteriales bacterium]
MKKVILSIAIAVAPLMGFSQSVFDKYENMDQVSAVIINKGMIDLVGALGMDEDDQESRDFMEIAKGLKGIKVFFTEDKGIGAEMGTTVQSYLKSGSMEELMRVKDEGTNVKFYVKNGRDENHITELLMFVSGIKNMETGEHGRQIETVLVSLNGDLDLDKIGALTKKMNLPKELNKAGKKDGK